MIYIAPEVGSKELLPVISRIGFRCEITPMPFGDACFYGNGPEGQLTVGIERKTVNDILQCIDDARYAGHQRVGMAKMYRPCILIIEGLTAPSYTEPFGLLYQLFKGVSWGPARYRSREILYSKLHNYLLSVALSGVIIVHTRDIFHTAFSLCETYSYFQKKWADHTSMMEIHKVAIPTLNSKPSLVRRWATDLSDIGVKLSQDAEMLFKRPIVLAQSSEVDWLKIRGIGVKTAQRIVREIWGK